MNGIRTAIKQWPFVAALSVLGLGLLVGVVLGVRLAGPQTLHGLAHSAEGAISAEADGWTYGIPLDVAWTDQTGSWHDRGRPACLPPSSADIPISFQAVGATAGGVGWRGVVWVDCRGVQIDAAAR